MSNFSVPIPRIRIFERTQKISYILIVLSAFFASWGAGLHQISKFNLSRVFPSIAILLILYWALFTWQGMRTFPRLFNFFFIFTVLHIILTYTAFFPDEFTFSAIQKWNFRHSPEGVAMHVARFLIFALYAFALAQLLKIEKLLVTFALAYAAGFATVMLLSSYSVLSGNVSSIRLSGGFLNPNSFGASAIMCIFLNLFVLLRRNSAKWIKIFAVSFIGIGMIGLLLSAARACILGLAVGLFIFFLYIPKMRMKIKLVAGIIVIVSFIGFFSPQYIWQTLETRSNILEKIESGGVRNSNVRFTIWKDYIREMPKYVLTGVGFHRTQVVTKDSYTTNDSFIPHNKYLHILVDFGFIGFLLFMGGLRQLWKRISYHSRQMKISLTDSIILGFFSAWLIMLLFGSYSGSRDLWIFLGIVAAYGARREILSN